MLLFVFLNFTFFYTKSNNFIIYTKSFVTKSNKKERKEEGGRREKGEGNKK